MDVQQWEKKSLAAYIHWFKTEPKWCNFTNDAATIRIFIKGLRNTHSLAAWMYEKDPQILKDTITEIEKLNAAQQLTTTIFPSLMVNMMSNEEDQCFQCQEPGHIAQYCPHIRCYECDDYGLIIMDFPHKIPPLGTLVPHYKAHRNHHTRLSSRHHWEDWERGDRSRSQSRYSRYCSSSHHDLHRGYSRSQQWDGSSCYRSSSRWSHSAHWGHSCRPCHDTSHWPHCKSFTPQFIRLLLTGLQ